MIANAETQKHRNAESDVTVCDCRMQALDGGAFAAESELVDVVVAPAGQVQSSKGNFLIDREAFAAVLAAFDKQQVAIPFDYEHQTLGGDFASPDGTAPLAGEIRKLRFEEGKGIIASVRWTERARKLIRAGEYIYASPVIVKRDGKVVGLHSVGLTNKPAIIGMERVAAKDTNDLAAGQRKDATMNELLLIGKDLGLAEADCTVEKITNKIGEHKKAADAAGGTVRAVCKALGLKEDAAPEALVLAATKLKGEADKSDALAERLQKLEASQAQERAQKKIDALVAAHKLNPNDKPEYEAAMKLACSDPATLDALYANKKPFVEAGRTAPPEGGAKPAGGKEEELVANAVKEHGSFAAGIEALQAQLMRGYLDTGLTRAAARQQCEREYPKVFGVAA